MEYEPRAKPVEDMQNYDFLCYPQNQRLHFDSQQAVSARHAPDNITPISPH